MNPFRTTYRELTVEEKGLINNLKSTAELLYNIYELPNENGGTVEVGGREIALAKTKLEESVMWAVKAITK